MPTASGMAPRRARILSSGRGAAGDELEAKKARTLTLSPGCLTRPLGRFLGRNCTFQLKKLIGSCQCNNSEACQCLPRARVW
jgi:hypothetical protein